jgi:uncharacterized protein YneF (UPF0154 family)
MRKVGVAVLITLAALLFVVAGGLVWYAWESINNLWADYSDSPTWMNLGFGVSALLVAGVFTGFGVWILHRSHRLLRANPAIRAR